MPTILIELPGGEGVVRRDDGEIVVTSDVSDGRDPALHHGGQRPGMAWVDEDRSVVGGLLPAGAVSAEVVDDRAVRINAEVGRGAFAVIVDLAMASPEPVVCCRDEAGAPVRWPLAADYPIVPVDDSNEACPACGAVSWEEYVPTESWIGGRPGPDSRTVPNPIVVCRVCGHEEPEGTFFGADQSSEADEEAAHEDRLARVLAERRAQRWYSDTMTLRAVTFPIYVAEGWPAIVGTQRSRGDQLTTLTISHHDRPDADFYSEDWPRIEITTSIDDFYRGELREAQAILSSWLQHPGSDWPDASNAARTLWLAAYHRELRRAVLAATRSETLIAIDGAPEPFLTLSSPTGRWVATRRHNDLTITVAGDNLDPAMITIKRLAAHHGQGSVKGAPVNGKRMECAGDVNHRVDHSLAVAHRPRLSSSAPDDLAGEQPARSEIKDFSRRQPLIAQPDQRLGLEGRRLAVLADTTRAAQDHSARTTSRDCLPHTQSMPSGGRRWRL